MLSGMATLVCSKGHANPLGQRFCGECGEDLTQATDLPEVERDTSSTEAATPGPEARHWLAWIVIAVGVLCLVIVGGALLQRSNRSSTPTVTTSAPRGDRQVVWYFPASTPATDLVSRVDEECAAQPDLGSIVVNLIDLGTDTLAPVDTKTYPCP
jgi:hypothetical protein